MWMPNPASVNSNYPQFLVNIYSFVVDTLSTIGFLIGKLSIYDTPKRIFDIIGIVGVGIGVISIVPIVYFFKKNGMLRNVLFWLIVTPLLIFLSELDMNTFDYTMVAMPFLAIVTGLGISKFVDNYKVWGKRLAFATLAVLIGFGCYNCYYFDIGNILDKNLGASRLYYDEFAKVPDGAILMPNGAWEWEAIFMYNKEYDRHIYPVAIDILPSHQYTELLQKDGVKLVVSDEPNLSIRARQIAMSIIELNENVYTTVYTDTSTFSSIVVNTNGDTKLVELYDKVYADELAANPTFKWQPSNPYKIIDTSLMITEWNYVLLSNYNISFLFLLVVLGFGAVVFVGGLLKKRDQTDIEN
jgi:hypothetical protein